MESSCVLTFQQPNQLHSGKKPELSTKGSIAAIQRRNWDQCLLYKIAAMTHNYYILQSAIIMKGWTDQKHYMIGTAQYREWKERVIHWRCDRDIIPTVIPTVAPTIFAVLYSLFINISSCPQKAYNHRSLFHIYTLCLCRRCSKAVTVSPHCQGLCCLYL